MLELKNKVAVITGAGSGFGRELAILCAQEGMKLVLADIDEAGLAQTRELLPSPAADLLLQRCNVAKAEEVDALASATEERFGGTDLLFNNAGVMVTGPIWTATLDDWKWVLDINLMGVVHGIRSFVPRMLARGTPAHVVNTASAAGLLSVPASGVYCASKHAVVTVTECLYHELQVAKAPIGVSLLCPAFVNTGIADAARNRPAELGDTAADSAPYEERVRQAVRKGKLSAADIARTTLDAVKANRFYILTHPAIRPSIEMRMRDILDETQPRNPMP